MHLHIIGTDEIDESELDFLTAREWSLNACWNVGHGESRRIDTYQCNFGSSAWNPFASAELKRRVFFVIRGRWSMKKIILVGLAIFAVSTSGALAAKKGAKVQAPAATANAGAAAPPIFGQVSAADRALYAKSQRESGMKKK